MMTPLDRIAERNADILILIGRIAMAILFVFDLYGKLANLNRWFSARNLQVLPFPPFWAAGAIVLVVLGLIGLILGYRMRLGALALAVFCLFAAFLSHRFWEMDAAQYQLQFSQFFKDIALAGGYIALFVCGAGLYSLDARRA